MPMLKLGTIPCQCHKLAQGLHSIMAKPQIQGVGGGHTHEQFLQPGAFPGLHLPPYFKDIFIAYQIS